MLPLRLKNLFLSSLLVILLASCSPTLCYKFSGKKLVTEVDVLPIVNKNNSMLYKANMKLYNNYFSGLILLKQTDSITFHLVFVTELGMKMFDYEIKNNQFKLIYVFEPLNQPRILNLLENDFKLILLQNLRNKEAKTYQQENEKTTVYKIEDKKTKIFYFVDKINRTVDYTIVKGRVSSKVRVNYRYNDSLSATQIKLKHKGIIRLKMELNKISK